MSAGARVIDPLQYGRNASEVPPGLVGIPHAGPFSNPMLQHCPGAISAPQLLKAPTTRDESSRDASEGSGSGTHVLADSPADDTGVEQQHTGKHGRDGWTGKDDITRMLLQDGGSMMDATGALDDLLGPLVNNPQGATIEDDLRNGELLFELEPYAERSKILVGEDDDDTMLDDEPLLVPSSPSSRQDSCHPVPSVDWGLLTPSGASLVSMATTAQVKDALQPSTVANRASKLSVTDAPAAHGRSGSSSSLTATPAAVEKKAAAANTTAPVFSSSSKFGGPCMHCGATESPQWRRGPPEKPMLCNACGTRYRRSNQLGPVPGPATQKGGVQKKKAASAVVAASGGQQLARWSSGSRSVRKS